MNRIGFVVGLTAEARIAARFGGIVLAGGGTPAGAGAAAERLAGEGATALVSFGLAGGLDPTLRPGDVLIPQSVLVNGERMPVDAALAQRFGGLTRHTILAGEMVAATGLAKAVLYAATGAHAVDLESGAVAAVASARGLPFAVVRAICDPAERSLPSAALIALDSSGGIGVGAVLWSVVRNPRQIPGLLALASDVGRARGALVRLTGGFDG